MEQIRFKINPHDPCVAKKMANGKQTAVTWHVDDLKVSHVEEKEATKFCLQLSDIYGSKIKVNHSKVHLYLEMDFGYSTNKTFKVSMIPYAKQIKDKLPEAIIGTSPTSAAYHLFHVHPDNERKLPPEEQAQSFHRSTAK